MKISNSISRTQIKRVRGQGMSEYMIIVGVIAAAAIATFGFFGKTVETQVGQQATVMAGGATTAQTATSVAGAAVSRAANANNLAGYDTATTNANQ